MKGNPMSDRITCPLCGQEELFTLVSHLRSQHSVEPEVFRKQFPKEPLCTPAFTTFLVAQNVHRRSGVLNFQLDVAGVPMTARYGVEHPLIPQPDDTFVWTDPCKDVAE